MADPIRKADHKFTYQEYCSWPDDERWELIEGTAYCMSPAPSRHHQKISGTIYRLIANYLEDTQCEIYAAPFDVILPSPGEDNLSSTTVVQPDISIICDVFKLTNEGCTGAPDLVIEILSPSTSKKDMSEKFVLYEKHGVQEYWIIDPGNEYIHMFHLQKDGTYDFGELLVKPSKAGVDLKVHSEILNELEIGLNEIFPND